MPRPRTKRPAYRHYKPKNLAVVRIEGKDHYLGPFGSDASYERYHRLLAERFAQSAPQPLPAVTASPLPVPLTISELVWKYWTFARVYYRKNEEPTSEQHCIRSALRPLHRLFGQTSVADFGPLSLKQVREHMIAAGLSRTTINKYVHRIKRTFAWGVEQELMATQFWLSHRGQFKRRTVRLSETSLTLSENDGTSEVPWSRFTRYKETPWSFLAWKGQHDWLQLPKSAFPSIPAQERCRELFARHLKRSTWFFGS